MQAEQKYWLQARKTKVKLGLFPYFDIPPDPNIKPELHFLKELRSLKLKRIGLQM